MNTEIEGQMGGDERQQIAKIFDLIAGLKDDMNRGFSKLGKSIGSLETRVSVVETKIDSFVTESEARAIARDEVDRREEIEKDARDEITQVKNFAKDRARTSRAPDKSGLSPETKKAIKVIATFIGYLAALAAGGSLIKFSGLLQ